ncbi:MAG TPA: exo 1,3/1,4-beta-D-glucan glucohydrolase [Phenylobacterium sp.]
MAAFAAEPPGVAHPALWPAAHSPGLVDPKTEAFVTRLMSGMSVEEKVGQLIQGDISNIKPQDLRDYPLGSILAGGDSPPLGAPDRSPAPAWLATAKAFRAVSLEKRPGHTPIPVMFGVDAVHGNNNVVGATLFPHNVGLGAMHDPALMRRIGEVTARETAAAGIDWAFGPTLAVVRDDRWGRSYEGYSEEPQIVAAYARQMVTGLQGPPATWPALKSGHVAASPKHFLGDGGTENGKDQGDNRYPERDLARLNAPGYVAAIDAGAMTVMASFSSWQGVKMHGNRSLLTDVLKQRMGFQGFVVGDWNAQGQVPGCTNESCPAAINAGLDMVMAADSWKGLYRNTLAQVRSGEIPMARVDDAVRRILRVKVKAGLFGTRPLEGRFEQLGSPAGRAVARQAVRESLVLLKNNGSVLPIRGSAHVLVAGDGADNVAKQAGGWTLSWQGQGNKPADFPGAQSIWSGLRDAVARAGGSAELSPDGAFTRKPDVAIVVFGEDPYAEFQGDRATLEYQPGSKSDLALLRKLKAQGVPVVSVFLSGRPLWVNPELNASDAFVAAWLPGSEGAGVADVLIGDAHGKPRHDFQGKLSYSWPKLASQGRLNRGEPGYDPLFAYGYGLTYAAHPTLAPLPEISGVAAQAANTDLYLAAGKVMAPWRLALSDAGGESMAVAAAAASVRGVLSSAPVDAGGVQGAGLAFTWSGAGEAGVTVVGPPVDLTRQANGDMALLIQYRVDRPPSGPVRLAVGKGGAPLERLLTAAPAGQWRAVKVKLACFRNGGEDLSSVTAPVSIRTAGQLGLSVAELRLTANQNDAICP